MVAMDPRKLDFLFLLLLAAILAGLPLAIRAYDRSRQPRLADPHTREFILTGDAHRGWVLGEVRANDILFGRRRSGPVRHPVIEVDEGDRVVLKLRSADVTHGFSLKAFGIYITGGIAPGKTVFVSFKADRTGRFDFQCNVYCGDIHPYMKGTLVVRPKTSRPGGS